MKTNEILKLIGDKAFLDKIYQFSYRRCNTSYEAEDLCSDIILAVISAVHKQESIENFMLFSVDCCAQSLCRLLRKRETVYGKQSAWKTVIMQSRQKRMKLIVLSKKQPSRNK